MNLVSKSEYILRETKSRFKNPAVLWSTGKDSTCTLSMIRNMFSKVPFPVVHLDTGRKFPEMYEFRDRIKKEWDLDLIVAKSKETPSSESPLECCNTLKTETLKRAIKDDGFDALIISIRRDEHYMRNIERHFSPRDKEFKWHIVKPKGKTFETLQNPELWDLYQTDFGEDCSHVRVHPILHWTEMDVWKYTKENNIPVNPLYFSKNGKRFRSIGCIPCTTPFDSTASNIDEIIRELETTKTPERSGREQDKEREETMRKLRSLGYM